MAAFGAEIAIDKWLREGAPADKLVLGVPVYSRGWTGVTDQHNGLFQSSTGPAPGTYEDGIADYKKIKNPVGSGYQIYRDPEAGQSWIFDGSTFWTFDDPVEMRRKMDFIKASGLGGAMIWSMDGDTSTGDLLTAIATALGG